MIRPWALFLLQLLGLAVIGCGLLYAVMVVVERKSDERGGR